MPDYPDTPGFRSSRQNWDFNGIGDNELVVACPYEWARESILIMITLKGWLHLAGPRAALFQRAKEKNIDLKDVHHALLNYMKVVRFEWYRRRHESECKPDWPQELRECIERVFPGYRQRHESECKPDWPKELPERVERDFPAAVKLLSDLSDQFHEVACSQRAVAEFERDVIVERINAGLAAARERGAKFGRPRTLDKHVTAVAELKGKGLSNRAIAVELKIPAGSVSALLRR